MKHNIILTLIFFSLMACAQKESQKPATETTAKQTTKAKVEKDSKKEHKDPLAATPTLQDVAKIALVQADQFKQMAQKRGITDTSKEEKVLSKAHYLFRKGEYKKAQIKAVEAKHLFEDAMFKLKAQQIKDAKSKK